MDAKFYRDNAVEEQFDIKIDAQGQWYHQGSPIGRDTIAKLFSTVLHYDAHNDDYWLITPVEQGRIQVEDVPYIIVNYTINDNELIMDTNLGHQVTADKNNAITCRDHNGLPYIHVHNNAYARLNRSVREKLVHLALEQDGYDETKGVLTLSINGAEHIIAKDDTA